MSQRSPLLPIFLIVLVDVLGFTIVIPLLSLYAERFGASPLVATTLVSVYAICSLISTPIIGNLSDRFGRRPLLLVSQAGTCVGFVILGVSNSLWMVFVGRILDGITAGNLSTAQAYISDHTAPENRAKAFGVIGIAFGVGFMFGPGLGGWLSSSFGDISPALLLRVFEHGGPVLPSFGMHLPFLVSACLSALSILCTYLLLPRELPPQNTAAVVPAGPAGRRPGAFDFKTYADYFKRPQLGAIYLQFFLFTFAFSAFTSGFALFAEQRFHWSARETGYLFTYAGFLGIILQGGVIGRLVKKYGEVRLALAGFASAVVGYAMLGIAETLLMIVVTATVMGFGSGILRPVLTSRITQVVGRHEQGVALGISGSLSSLAMTLAPPSGGFMLTNGWTTQWALVSAVAAALGLIAAFSAGTAPKPELSSPK